MSLEAIGCMYGQKSQSFIAAAPKAMTSLVLASTLRGFTAVNRVAEFAHAAS
jgi:hypothetical protein